MPFDVAAAKRAGYSDGEIADYLAHQAKFNAQKARASGYDDREIIDYLNKPKDKGLWDRATELAGQAYDAVDRAMEPARKAIGYDPEAERAGREKIIADTRRRQQQDIGQQDGFLDRVGDLFTRGDIAASAGINRAASGMAMSPAERDSYVRSARLEEGVGNTKIDGEATWDDVKGNWTNLPRFVAEQGVSSLPSMIQNFAGAPGFIANTASNIGSIAQSRARADGRQDATGSDVAFAAPFGAASSALDAAGLQGMVGSVGKGIIAGAAKDAAIEGVTEAIQSGLEYTGGAVGTKQGFDARTAAEQMLQGGLVGAGVGGAFGAVQESGHAAVDEAGRLLGRRPDDVRAPPLGTRERVLSEAATVNPEDQASPLDTSDIVAGRVEIADATSTKAVNNALSATGLPKVGETVSVGNLPGGKTIVGKIEDHFADDSGQGLVITPEGGGKPIREYLDTLNELGVTITPFDPTAEADAIDARLAAEPAIPAQDAGVPSPSSAPAQETAPPRAPAGSTARGGAVNSPEAVTGFMSRVRRAESGGNDNAKNTRSSATGRYQFTDGTWLTTYRAEFGDTGESREQILAKRGDGAVQDRLMQRLTTDNARALQQTGAQVTEGNLYIAHFAGAGGARAIINSQPQTPIEQVIGTKAVEANPFLKGKTTGDVVRWAAEKMGGPVPATTPQIDAAATETARPDPYEQAMQGYRDWQARQSDYADQPVSPRTQAQDASIAPETAANQTEVGKTPTSAPETIVPDLYHGGQSGLTQNDIQIIREGGQKQGKRGRVYGGFYATGNIDEANGYASMREGGATYRLELKPGIKIEEKQGDITRLSPQTIDDYRSRGIDIIVGKDPRGRTEYAVINRDAVTGLKDINPRATTSTPEAAPEAQPAAFEQRASTARVEDTVSGKSVAVMDATDADRAAIADAGPEAKAMRRKDGALIYAKKYGDQIRAALAQPAAETGTDMAGEPIDKEWTQFAETSGTLGIPRAEMPQIKAEHRGAMVNFLNARDISHQEETVPASSLRPSQAEFSPEKVQKAKDYEGGNRSILISADNHVLDGHHQWLAARDKGEDVRAIRLKAPIRDLIQAAHEFPSSETADGATTAVPATDKTPVQERQPARPEPQSQNTTDTPATENADQTAQPDKAAEDADAAFKRVWKSREFQKAMKKIGDLPQAESPVAAALVRGWTEGKSGDTAALEREFRSINVASPEYRPHGFNPRQGYLEGFYAAVMPEPTQIRVVGDGAGFIDASTAWARIDEKLNSASPSSTTETAVTPTPQEQTSTEPVPTANVTSQVDDAPNQSIPEEGEPVASLTGDELGSWTDMLDLQKKARAWYRRNLMARSIMASDGVAVSFGRAGEGKMRAGDRIMRAVPAIRDIIERGEHEGPLPPSDKWAARGQIAAHRYTALVEIDGQIYRFGVLVQEMKDGRRFYVLSDNPDGLGAGGRSSLIEGASQHGPKEITPGDINLFVVDQSGNSDVPSDLTDTRSALDARLGKLRLSDKVRLAIADTLGGQAAGQYRDKLITIATDTAQDAAFTLDHEAIHALRDLGLFNNSEWAILASAARRDPGLMRSIDQRYSALSPDARVEEAVADLFARHQDGRYKAAGTVERVFKLLRQVFEAVRNAFAGRGLRTAEGVMRNINNGAIGRRNIAGIRGGDARQMVAWHGSPHEFDRFTLGAVGTGEGAQAYGWGLYFAGRKEVAEHYRRALALKPLLDKIQIDGDVYADEAIAIAREEGQLTDKESELLDAIEADDFLGFDYLHQALRAAFREPENFDLSPYLVDAMKNQGRLYQVDIPEDGEFLLWDKSVGQQSDMVHRALIKWAAENYEGRLPALAKEIAADRSPKGGEVYKKIVETLGSPRAASLALRDVGIAGIKYLDGASRKAGDGSFNYVVFDDARAQVMAKFSVPEQEAALNLAGALHEKSDNEKVQAAVDYLRVRFQDRMLPVLRAQEEVSRQLGADVGENSNPYLDEELMTGRIGARMDRMMEEHITPLLDAMRADEVELQDFEDYLYARHAPERNAQIAAINPEFSEGEGSGMTDLEAAAIMSRIRKDGKTDIMERLAERYDAMMRETMERRIEAGLMSADEAQAWRDTYEHYVPLRGQKEMEAGTDAPRIRRQSGISVKGKESRRAYGRRTRADDIFAHSILQAQEAIVRAEQNKVAQAFLELARSAPDPEFWTIDKVEKKKRINGTTGMVEHYFDNRVAPEDAPYTVTVKVNGEEHRITMNRNNPQARDIADSMRNLSAAQLSGFVSFFGKVNRVFSAINTRFSPPFIVTNAARDVMTAMVTLQQNEDMPGLARAVFSDYRKALTAKSTGDTEWAKWRREWEMSGGKVAFNQTGDLNQIKADIARKIERAANPNMARNAWNAFFDGIEAANEAVERAIRLSVYKNARERGASPKRAASMALNVTTNFSRKGRFGPFMNSLYAFFNAGTQGTATLFVAAARSKKVRRAMGALAVMGLAQEFLNAMLSDDDDDGQSFYDKIPQYEKDNNFILMIPGSKGDYLKYPLAKGLNVLPALGRSVASVMRGAQTAGQAAIGMGSLLLDGFNPIGGGGTVWNFFAPTAADPFVDIWANRNFTGKPIAPETFKGEAPDNPSAGYHPNASFVSKMLTRGLNELTGGDSVVPGAVSIAPEIMDYVFGQVTGGAGRFVGNLFDLGPALLDPNKDMTINDWPIISRVAGHTPDWVDRSLFYQRADELATLKERLKGYAKNEDAGGLQAYLTKNEDQARLIPAVDQARKWLSKGSKAKRENMKAYDDGAIDKATFESNRQLIEAGDMQVIQQFNTLWVSQIDKRDGTRP